MHVIITVGIKQVCEISHPIVVRYIVFLKNSGRSSILSVEDEYVAKVSEVTLT